MEGTETLSDHEYIRFRVSDPSMGRIAAAKTTGANPRIEAPRWALKKMDVDGLRAAAMIKAWVKEPLGPLEDADDGALRLRGAVTEVCDVAMPRCRSSPRRPAVYWWSRGLAELRQECMRARRAYTRCRRRRDDVEMEDFLREAYTDKKKELQRAIRMAKAKAWDELVETVENDPWGRPYKLVRKKLAKGGPPTTERLQPAFLRRVVDTLFPNGKGDVREMGRPPMPDPVPWLEEEHEVSPGELAGELKRLRAKKTAPGPDGIPAKALAMATTAGLGESVLKLYNKCLETGRFPRTWKEARMVLIPKEGKPEDSPSAYRPICLLDEAGKLFERVLAARLRRHLSQVGSDLADCQFGFREGRSTVDAIMRVRTLAEEAVGQGKGVVAVSLDIANAFNSLPWECIRRALIYHEVPSYLRAVIGDYLRDRYIVYSGRYGATTRRAAERRVPQGSVLGPLLWNLGYDWVLRGALLPGLSLACYAYDTLVMAWGKNWDGTIRLAQAGVGHVVTRIRTLGLKVALEKTEAVWFSRPRSRGPPRAQMDIDCPGR